MDIRSDRQKGLSYVELGRKYHMDPRTAKRYAESPQKPEYTLSEPKPTKMDPGAGTAVLPPLFTMLSFCKCSFPLQIHHR